MKVNFPELGRIKIQCEKLISKVNKIELKIKKREDYFYSKSDEWQESKKGQEYEEYTDHLEECSEVAKEHIQTILDAVEELEDQTK